MTRPSPALRYGVPVLAVAAAMLLRWPLWGVLGGELAFLFLWPVVIGCAWWGGLGPGLVATALSALSAAFFLLEPRFSFAIDRPAEMVGLAVFAAVNVAVSLLCGKLHRASRQAESRAGEVARQREWLRVSLTSIGDAVVATDTEGRVSFLNPTAQVLTGWEPGAARGQPLERVFPIINEQTRQPVENPVARVLREGVVVGLANHTVLVSRDGTERPIEDSAAPIKADDGSIIGVILVFHDVSESRRAEALLRESEANYRNLFESMEEGYCVIEMIFDGDDHPLDYRFLKVNPAFERQTGIRDAEGRLMREIAPAHEQHWFDIYGRIARTGETVRFENPAAALGRWYDVCAFRVGPPERRHVGIVFTDITGRKQMMDALRASEEQFRTSFELAAVGKVQIDPATRRFVRVNRKFCDLTGYAPDELLGLTPDDLTHPDDREEDRRRLSRMLGGVDAVYSHDKRYVRKDGQPVWVNVTATLVRDGDGRPVRTIGVVQDMTARRAAEEALRESEERFRTLANSIPQLAWTARPDGHIYWYNRRWYEYTGTTPEQMEGWGWQSVHDPDELPRVLERWRASIATGEPFEMVFPLRAADGGFRPFLTRVVPLRGEGGRVLQWFGTNTDISDLRAMQARLEEADRRKDQWVMMLAHELRNPLAPIRNGLQLLRSPDADRRAVEQAGRMMDRQVGHLARIIEDLLDVSRLMKGRVELRTERLDLGRVARTVVEDERSSFDRAGVTLDADLPELPAWVNADPTRLTQVVGNLLTNAAKFTARGGTVTVGVRADHGRGQAVLTVRDTGVGIEPDLLPRLFEAFTQADTSLDRSKGGLGLGLSVVKGLVELHGGTVEAASEGPGRGAEFVVRLPLQPEPAAVADAPARPGRAPTRLRVLVVEDNRDAADSLKMLLEVFGYDVTVAYTGPDGVAAAAWQPDAVVCDIGLPGLDGFGVVRALRQHPATAKARMIAVTGYGGEEDRLKTREAGFDAHLTKPADPAKLQELLSVAAGSG